MLLREPWRTRLLFLSFALNLFTVPLVASHFLHRHPGGPPSAPRPQIIVDRMAGQLPPADAERFRTIMERRVPEMEVARARMEAARTALSLAIGNTPYDEAAVRHAMTDWQQSWLAWSDDLGNSMLGALAELSPEGRHRLAEAGLRRPHR